MTFTRDLAFGRKYEDIALTLSGEMLVNRPEGVFKEWDFQTDKATYEVKSDRQAYKYGMKTMFIEYECRGKPSGIATTTADVWFYFLVRPNGTSRVYKLPTASLRDMCKGCVVKSGGDNYASRGYIVPLTGEGVEV